MLLVVGSRCVERNEQSTALQKCLKAIHRLQPPSLQRIEGRKATVIRPNT